jgi:hypothetical protein
VGLLGLLGTVSSLIAAGVLCGTGNLVIGIVVALAALVSAVGFLNA